MSNCPACGSPSEVIDDGREVVTHYLGCLAPREPGAAPDAPQPAALGETVEQCEYGECGNPKYSSHPRVKFCETHRDPKNRKE